MDVPSTLQAAITDTAPSFWLIADQLNARNETERLDYIRSGFPPGWVKVLRNAFRLSNSQLEALLATSVSTLERRQRQQRPLDIVGSERLDRVAALATHAAKKMTELPASGVTEAALQRNLERWKAQLQQPVGTPTK